jgi:hypothetical protein
MPNAQMRIYAKSKNAKKRKRLVATTKKEKKKNLLVKNKWNVHLQAGQRRGPRKVNVRRKLHRCHFLSLGNKNVTCHKKMLPRKILKNMNKKKNKI